MSSSTTLAKATALALAVGVPGGAALADESVTISYSQKVGDQLSFWIALDGGYFKAQGLDVDEQYLPSQQGIPALLAGQVQMMSIGGADGLSAVAQGVRLKYVAVYAPIYTFQLWAQPGFATPPKLKGQKVASSTTGSGYTGTLVALQQLGLAPSDVILVDMGSAQNNAAALLAGSVAATATTPPVTFAFAEQGLVELVDLAKKRIPNLTTGLAAEASYIAAHRPIVQAAVDAMVAALKREKTDRTYAEAELRAHLGIKDPRQLDFTYDFFAREITPSLPLPDAAQLEPAQRILGRKNPRARAVDLASMIDPSFVETAARGGSSSP